MKKTLLLLFVALMLSLAAFVACNKAPKASFVLSGTLEGITEGKIILSASGENEIKPDTVIIENGEFVFTGYIPEPTEYTLEIIGKEMKGYLYAENAHMTYTAHADSLWKTAKITGGKVQEDENTLQEKRDALYKKYNISELSKEYRSKTISETRKAEITELFDTYNKKRLELVLTFIKENPASYYSAILIKSYASGKSAVKIEEELDALDPKLATYSTVVKLREKLEEMKKAEVGIENIISNAYHLSYRVDGTFKGEQHKGIVYLAVFPNDNICALKNDGSVHVFDPKGEKIFEFNVSLKGKPSSIAVDKSNNIYVLGTEYEKQTRTIRGKVYEFNAPIGVECFVYNTQGKKKDELKLPGILTATGARIVGENLVIADYRNRLIAVIDAKTGKMESSITDLRTCCGILDFSVNSNNEILVANLGAFRVQSFDFSGKNIISFGQRGETINDFHGCCNPVSVAYLSNSGIVTVEKSPTRIKVYSKDGAKQIEGIEELVEGCTYIPMIVDSKDNLYLASAKKGMIKCISSN